MYHRIADLLYKDRRTIRGFGGMFLYVSLTVGMIAGMVQDGRVDSQDLQDLGIIGGISLLVASVSAWWVRHTIREHGKAASFALWGALWIVLAPVGVLLTLDVEAPGIVAARWVMFFEGAVGLLLLRASMRSPDR